MESPTGGKGMSKDDPWCPENDFAYQAEMAAKHPNSSNWKDRCKEETVRADNLKAENKRLAAENREVSLRAATMLAEAENVRAEIDLVLAKEALLRWFISHVKRVPTVDKAQVRYYITRDDERGTHMWEHEDLSELLKMFEGDIHDRTQRSIGD
jgi:hypothetical protein